MKIAMLIALIALAGCSNTESREKALTAVQDACKRSGGELTFSFEVGPFGSNAKVSCTTRVAP